MLHLFHRGILSEQKKKHGHILLTRAQRSKLHATCYNFITSVHYHMANVCIKLTLFILHSSHIKLDFLKMFLVVRFVSCNVAKVPISCLLLKGLKCLI